MSSDPNDSRLQTFTSRSYRPVDAAYPESYDIAANLDLFASFFFHMSVGTPCVVYKVRNELPTSSSSEDPHDKFVISSPVSFKLIEACSDH
jgi:hypothetical protein